MPVFSCFLMDSLPSAMAIPHFLHLQASVSVSETQNLPAPVQRMHWFFYFIRMLGKLKFHLGWVSASWISMTFLRVSLSKAVSLVLRESHLHLRIKTRTTSCSWIQLPPSCRQLGSVTVRLCSVQAQQMRPYQGCLWCGSRKHLTQSPGEPERMPGQHTAAMCMETDSFQILQRALGTPSSISAVVVDQAPMRSPSRCSRCGAGRPRVSTRLRRRPHQTACREAVHSTGGLPIFLAFPFSFLL